MRFVLMASLVTTLGRIEAVGAQTPLAPVVFLDATLVGAQPTGDFGLNVDEGWGFELGGRYQLDPGGHADGLRLSAATLCKGCRKGVLAIL